MPATQLDRYGTGFGRVAEHPGGRHERALTYAQPPADEREEARRTLDLRLALDLLTFARAGHHVARKLHRGHHVVVSEIAAGGPGQG